MNVIRDDRVGCNSFNDYVVSRETDMNDDEFTSITEYACGCVERYYHDSTPGCRCREKCFDCDNCRLIINRRSDCNDNT